jgi:hypothetical protein
VVSGGGVYLVKASAGSFNCTIGSGGSISGNTTAGDGGGVYADAFGTSSSSINLAINGGISGNTASGDGGGVYVSSSGISTSADGSIGSTGIIGGNRAVRGGGVYLNGNEVAFTLNGGTIRDNIASAEGGGVYAANTHSMDPSFTMSGGAIVGNSAVDGGGIYYLSPAASLAITPATSGGTILSNTATGRGGGIYHNGLSFVMSGLLRVGDEIYLGSGKLIEITGALMTGTLFMTIEPDSYTTPLHRVVLQGSTLPSYTMKATDASLFRLKNSAYHIGYDGTSPGSGTVEQ